MPLLIFALPIADAASALARRVSRGGRGEDASLRTIIRHVVQPDRDHIHHQLMALGLSPRGTVVVLYAFTLLFAAIALATAQLG